MKSRIKRIISFVVKSPFKVELFFWIAGLSYLMIIDPSESGHLDLCLFKLYGFESCPGCGLGRSISFVFHGDIIHSLQSHPIGVIALVLILFRIANLFIKTNKYHLTTKGV